MLKTTRTPLGEQIIAWLVANPGKPQSVVEIAAEFPGADRLSILMTCELLRTEALLGRNGANTPTSPHRFYIKRRLAGI